MKIIGFGGLSESGKSYSGKYLERKYGIPRIKLVNILEKLRYNFFKNKINLDEFHDFLYSTENKFTTFLLDQMILEIEYHYGDHPVIVVESLRNPILGKHFKTSLGDNFENVYFEVAFLTRVRREAEKLGESVDEIIEKTYLKDQEKILHGALEFKELSDIIYDNNGTIQMLEIFLDDLVKNYI